MPLMDEFKEEREAIKQKGLKEKFAYFFYYYKWHVVAVAVVAAVVISLISHFINRKPWAVYICLINATPGAQSEEYIESFAEYAGIDTDHYEAVFDTSLYIDPNMTDSATANSMQKLAVYIFSADLDVMVSEPAVIERYTNRQTFYDLRDLLNPEQLAFYEPYFYYVDQTVIDAITAADDKGQSYDGGYPDPRQPDAMENPIPVGIYLDDCPQLREHFYFPSEELVLGVFINSSKTETALQFLDFIMQH